MDLQQDLPVYLHLLVHICSSQHIYISIVSDSYERIKVTICLLSTFFHSKLLVVCTSCVNHNINIKVYKSKTIFV